MKIFFYGFLFSFLLAIGGFAQNLQVDNQTSYPESRAKSKIAVQWATTAKEVADQNNALMTSEPLNTTTMKMLATQGKTNVTVPNDAEYFRVLVWTNGKGDPDYLSNWVDIVPNKTYSIQDEDLSPAVLMSGMGC
jgi:hypothetical protein